MITFDGWCGSGKTTQCEKLRLDLDVNFYNYHACFDSMDFKVKNSSDLSFFSSFYYVCSMDEIYEWEHQCLFLLDECFFSLIRELSLLECDERMSVLHLFVGSLLAQLDRKPIASFYLDIPFKLAGERARDRNLKKGMIGGGISDSLLSDPDSKEWDRRMLESAYLFQDEYSFFRVIDGNGSEDEVCLLAKEVLGDR